MRLLNLSERLLIGLGSGLGSGLEERRRGSETSAFDAARRILSFFARRMFGSDSGLEEETTLNTILVGDGGALLVEIPGAGFISAAALRLSFCA